MRLEVKVQPRSSKNALERDPSGGLKLKLTAPPVEGEANRAAIRYLAAHFGVSPSRVTLVRGETSRRKVFEIEGVSPPAGTKTKDRA